MTTIRFGILGSGFMGRTHAEAVRALPERAKLVAVAGGRRAAGLAQDLAIAHEPDAAALLARDDIDAVVITTPHHVHVAEATQAAARGKHALVEKPMSTSVADCEAMIDAAQRAKTTLRMGYHQRFRANNAAARALIADGAIGRPEVFQISMPTYAATITAGGFGGDWAWWALPESRGHVLNSAPHAIDLMRWFTGDDVITVSAFCRTLLPDLKVEDTTLALLELRGGAIATLFSSRALPAPSFPGEDFRIRITGSAGLIDLDPYGELRVSDERGWRTESKQATVGHEGANTAFGPARMGAYVAQIASFIDAIEGKPAEVGTAADGRAGVAAVAAMFDSSAQRRWVTPA